MICNGADVAFSIIKKKEFNETAKQAMIDEATVEILARDKDADGTMAKAKKLETEAKEHRTRQEESEAAWDAACDEQEAIIADVAAGNYEGAAQRMEACMKEISQYSEAAAEHERLATEKETEAGELRKTKMNEARRLAVMEVASETEKARAEMMGQANGKEETSTNNGVLTENRKATIVGVLARSENKTEKPKFLHINTEVKNSAKVEKETLNDIIEKDIHIPKSLGAKSVNHEICLPNDEVTTLTEGTWITKVTTIAGKGKERQIDEIEELIANYGGAAEKWEKKKGFGYVDYEGESYRAELHWYEEPTAGRWKFKVKPDADGNWFYDED